MRHLLFLVALLAAPLWGVAGPANGPARAARAAGMPVAESGGGDQNKDQRRAALRQALVPQQEAIAPASDAGGGRQLSPIERAELRRQLREQPSR